MGMRELCHFFFFFFEGERFGHGGGGGWMELRAGLGMG